MIKNILIMLQYSELLKTLVLRQIKVKYKRFLLGYLWIWIEPLATMFVLMFVVGTLLRAGTENFAFFLLCGLIPWTFFNASVSASTSSLTGNAGLIKKVYFPREILPLSIVLFHYFNFLLSLLLLIPLSFLLEINLTSNIFLLPIPMLTLFFLAYGLALAFSCITVYSREADYAASYMLKILFFLTPIFYSIENKISGAFFSTYMIFNPLAVIIMTFRGALMGHEMPEIKYIVISFLISFFVFIAGILIFKKIENEAVKRI